MIKAFYQIIGPLYQIGAFLATRYDNNFRPLKSYGAQHALPSE